MVKKVLAFDFGASSGRALLGQWDGEKLSLSELHRFSNDPVMLGDTFYWDFLRLFEEIKTGIRNTVNAGHHDVQSLGIDTWGVDFGLLDEDGRLLENPVHYRDARTDGIPEEVFHLIPREELYRQTGLEMQHFNTLFQLYSLVLRRPRLLAQSRTLLNMPDLFNYYLTGQRASEFSIASTSQLLEPGTARWNTHLMQLLGIPTGIFAGVVDAGTKIGTLTPALCEELNAPPLTVCAVPSHDTASAAAAVPVEEGEDYAFLSCGTWSLLGVEADAPIINEKSAAYDYTNEGGYARKTLFLKNIVGLWLMQECRRQWEREGNRMSFKDIDAFTIKAAPLQRFISPDYAPFMQPGNMPERMVEFCKKTGQIAPQSIGEFSRCITESLALRYRQAIEGLEDVKGSPVGSIRIIGGGVKDKLLCQYTANATKKRVYAGPIEATALGNIAVQLIACGAFSSLAQARAVIARSFPPEVYEPQDTELWDEAYRRYRAAADAI